MLFKKKKKKTNGMQYALILALASGSTNKTFTINMAKLT